MISLPNRFSLSYELTTAACEILAGDGVSKKAIRRLKKAGVIRYDREARRWVPSFASKPSGWPERGDLLGKEVFVGPDGLFTGTDVIRRLGRVVGKVVRVVSREFDWDDGWVYVEWPDGQLEAYPYGLVPGEVGGFFHEGVVPVDAEGGPDVD